MGLPSPHLKKTPTGTRNWDKLEVRVVLHSMCLKWLQVWSSDLYTHPVSIYASCPHSSKTSRMSHLPQVLCLQHPNEPITKHYRKPSRPLRNMTVCWSPWRQASCFAAFVRTWILLSPPQSLSSPLEFRYPPTTSVPLSSAHMAVR